MGSTAKNRLDKLLFEKGLVESPQKAQAMIMSGNILVNNEMVDKPGQLVSIEAEIVLKEAVKKYVSRGALKLEEAVEKLEIDVTGLICMDVGASTGGFTDFLLQNSASKVYSVDVGYGQLAWKIREDKRVVVLERTNIRHLAKDSVSDAIDLAVIDTSFISLKIVVPAVLKFLKKRSRILALIKPQFEIGKGKVGKGGVVRDPSQHEEVINNLSQFFIDSGLSIEKIITSPITGPKGNKEFIISLLKNSE